jgi:uncharacterized membrane protein
MNKEPSTNGLTRRSFIKRSVVAAVAVSSLTIFSGLVDARTEGKSGSSEEKCYTDAFCVADTSCRAECGQSGTWYATCKVDSKGNRYLTDCKKSL